MFPNHKTPDSLKNAILELCRMYGIRPDTSKGQHFLINSDILNTIVSSANLKPSDTVLEVGPGLGTMTALLAERAQKVIAVEIDRKLIDILRVLLMHYKNVEIIQGDILQMEPRTYISAHHFKVVANLPYAITSYFFRMFLAMDHKPEFMVLLVQKEVAERVCAKPGEMSMLSFFVQWYAEPYIIRHVSREEFWPVPQVDSSILTLTTRTDLFREKRLKKFSVHEQHLFQLVKFGFSSRRKQLHNNLCSGLNSFVKQKMTSEKIKAMLSDIGLNTLVRAQELTPEQWLLLAQKFSKVVKNP